jgi:DNA polymerase
MPKVSLDFETRSSVDLGDCGGYKCAEHPDSSVIVLAIKEGLLSDPTPLLSWDMTRPHNEAINLLYLAIEFGWEIHAFNSQYEWAYLKHVCPRQFGLPVPDINNLRCTMALCRSAGLPRSLAKCADFLKTPFPKDKMGRPLMRKFSIPDKKGDFVNPEDDVSFTAGGERMTAAEGFQRYVAYCERDVESEMAVAEKMKAFELKGYALDSFLATARLNDRGVPVDRKTLENAMTLYREHEETLTKEYVGLTGVNPTQNAKSLEWLQEQGYPGKSVNKDTRERLGGSPALSKMGKRALAIKGELSFAAVKKIPAMLNWVMDDGFIRGSFMWAGAQKTWRWTSEGPQWQNMKKPSKALRPLIEDAYQDVAKGTDLEMLSLCYGDPYEVIASLARYFVRFPDTGIFDADYSSVEAMILPMLIQCNRILETFERGEDPYLSLGESLSKHLRGKYEVPFEIDRDTAKTCWLATQFQGGWHAVFTATGSTWKREWCEVAAAIVRKKNPEFVRAWRLFQDTFVEALDRPNIWHKVTKYVSFGYRDKTPFPHMLMRLPSGRSIVMPLPEKAPITMVKVVDIDPKTKTDIGKGSWEQISGHFEERGDIEKDIGIGDAFLRPDARLSKHFSTWDLSYYGHTENTQYGRVKTYGGNLLQGATQGTGVDLLAIGVLEAEKQGFDPFLLVHDQCLTPAVGDKDVFVNALCTVPDWFKGFPLSADADEVRSYSKS